MSRDIFRINNNIELNFHFSLDKKRERIRVECFLFL